MKSEKSVAAAANRVVDLEAELETASNASIDAEALAEARLALHTWVDTVVGVVSSPGVGRVTLIHANGAQSGVTSPELPYLLARPIHFGKELA